MNMTVKESGSLRVKVMNASLTTMAKKNCAFSCALCAFYVGPSNIYIYIFR